MTADYDDLVSIRAELLDVENQASRGPRILSDALLQYRQADHDLNVARARARKKAKDDLGPKATVPDIDAEVVLNTIDEQQREINADAANKYAASRVKELERRGSSIQTRANLLREQMRLAGTGMTP